MIPNPNLCHKHKLRWVYFYKFWSHDFLQNFLRFWIFLYDCVDIFMLNHCIQSLFLSHESVPMVFVWPLAVLNTSCCFGWMCSCYVDGVVVPITPAGYVSTLIWELCWSLVLETLIATWKMLSWLQNICVEYSYRLRVDLKLRFEIMAPTVVLWLIYTLIYPTYTDICWSWCLKTEPEPAWRAYVGGKILMMYALMLEVHKT